MKKCIVCLTSANIICNCKCGICLNCLISWFEVKNNIKPIYSIECSCGTIYSREAILNQCQIEPYKGRIQTILFKEYLRISDLQPCPNKTCKNFGFLPTIRCDDPLTCDLCGTKWKDYSIQKRKSQIKRNIYNAPRRVIEFIYLTFCVNECPNCKIFISKDGGCQQMQCLVCKFQFCWYCKKEWKLHQEFQCTCHLIIISMLILFLLINIIRQLGFFVNILFNLCRLICICMLVNSIVFGIISGIYFIIVGKINLSKLQNNRREHLISNILKFFGGQILLIVTYFFAKFVISYYCLTSVEYICCFFLDLSLLIIFALLVPDP